MGHGSAHASRWHRIPGRAAVVVTAAISATGVWMHGAGWAMAPEAAMLTGTTPLSYNGQIAPARYLSGTPTTIIRWPAAATANRDGSPAAGQPCTTTILSPYSLTNKVIRVSGSSRLCY